MSRIKEILEKAFGAAEVLTIKDVWDRFHAFILKPVGAGPVQVDETRLAFYAGAMAMFDMVMEISDLPEAEACERLDALHTEIREHIESVRKADAAEPQ